MKTQPQSKKLGDRIETTVREGIGKLEKALKRSPSGKRPALYYLETFLKDRNVATVHPSSPFVVKKVIKALDLKHARSLVEYGPADGVITHSILHHLPTDGRLVAIERNSEFYSKLKRSEDPRLSPVHGDVRAVEKILREQGHPQVDRAVSGIPFSFLKLEERHALLAATRRILTPGGRFVAYQFTTHLIPLLKRHFDRVEVGFEILNLPPVFVFTCIKKG